MTRSLGIDVGSYSIKIAEVDHNGKDSTILGLFEIALPPDEDVSVKLRKFFASGTVKADRIAMGLGARPVLIKKLFYPFSDRRKVQQAVFAEFEDSIPFDLENYLIEFQKLGRVQKSHAFLAGLCHKDNITLLNSYLEGTEQTPSAYCLDNEVLARMALQQHPSIGNTDGDVFCVCDVGFQSTKLAIVRELGNSPKAAKDLSQNIIELRTLGKGALEIFDWMESQKNMSAADCEQWLVHRAKIKNQEGNQLSDETSDDVKTALKPILVEIYQTLQALKSKQGVSPKYILLTGGLTQLEGFPEFFAKEMRLETKVWDPLKGFATNSSTAIQNKRHRFSLALALADRSRPSKMPPSFNFRRSSLAERRVLTSALDRIFEPANRSITLSLLGTFFIFFLYQLASAFFITSERDTLKKELVANFRQLDPVLGKRAADSIDDPDRLSDMFENEKARQLKNIDPSRPSRSDLVLYLSQSIPSTVRTQTLQLNDTNNGATELSLDLSTPPGWDQNQKMIFQDQLLKDLEQKGFRDITRQASGSTIKVKAKWQETL